MVAVESAEPLSNATGNVCGAQDGEDDLPEDSLNALDTAFVAKDSGLELADEYVSVNAPNWHPIFHNPLPRIKPEPSSTLYYNDQRLDKQADTRSARLRKSGALDVQTKQFCQVIDVYKRTAKGDGLPADFDIRGSHSWEEVMYAARNAEIKSSHDGSKNILRRFGRGTQKHAITISPWLDLIPNGDYTSALCGSLKIAFSVAHRMKEKRTTITETFCKIPKTIKKAEDRLEEHPDDDVLYDAATELYLAVLKVIEGMLKYLVDTSTWKKIGALLLLPEKPIDVGLSEIERQMEVLLNRATTLQNRTINRTDVNVKDIQVKTDTMSVSTEYTETLVTNMSPFVGMTYTGVNEIKQRLEVNTMNEKEAFSGVINVLQESLRKSEWNRKRDARNFFREIRSLKKDIQASKSTVNIAASVHQATPPLIPSPELPFTQELLESLFGINPKLVASDVQKVYKEGKRSKTSSQSRGHWLLRHARFQAWLTSDETRGLLIDGNANGTERVSAMSFVCALLIQSLQTTDAAITISFFCGLHTLSTDPLSSAAGLMRSLISQLLSIHSFNLSFIDEDYEEQLHQNNLEYLLDLFRTLIEQLPSSRVLFCLIDGIAFYERHQDRNDIQALLETLSEITDDRGIGPVVKVLMTNPLRSRWAKDYFPEDRLQVPTNAGDGQMLSIHQVMRQTNRSAVFHEENSREAEAGRKEEEDEGDYERGNFGAEEEEVL